MNAYVITVNGQRMKTLEELKHEMADARADWEAEAARYNAAADAAYAAFDAAWEAADAAWDAGWAAWDVARVAYNKKLKEEADEDT